MGNEQQTRRDIDRLYTDLYLQGQLRTVLFEDGSPLINISSKTDKSDKGTLDAILQYYRLLDIEETVLEIVGDSGDIDLKNYVKKEELNSILSSYVTNDFANSNFAQINHIHSEYITRSEISDLDIDLTTLNLVPYEDNPNGVMCFDKVQKTIDELDIDLKADTMSNGYLKIEANLIERSS